jgi:hypothetical protein
MFFILLKTERERVCVSVSVSLPPPNPKTVMFLCHILCEVQYILVENQVVGEFVLL